MKNLKKLMILAGLTLTVAMGAYGMAQMVNANATTAHASCNNDYCE